MGRISRKVIQAYRRQRQDLEPATRPFASDPPDEESFFDDLAEDARDPLHALYLSVQKLAAAFAASASMSSDFKEGEFDEFRAAMADGVAEYAPGPLSDGPLTTDYFGLWSLFDLRFGEDRETIGACLLDLMKAIDAAPLMIAALENLCDSRMGVYEHWGGVEDRLHLRELVTGDELAARSTSGYQGERGQLWYARICPPVPPYGEDHVILTTPYVLIESSRYDWTAYLNKSLIGAGGDRREALAAFLKYGNDRFFWHEFIFQAFHHDQEGAIFLAGLPDVPASLPRRRARHPKEAGASSDGIDAASSPDREDQDRAGGTRTVKFSEPQRRAIAALNPKLVDRLKLDEKRPRKIELTCRELDQLEILAEAALEEARGAQFQPLKKILLAVWETKRLAAVDCVFQLQMTWSGADPPPWRRILIRDCSLYNLHRYIQIAMGWEDEKWYIFTIEGAPFVQGFPVGANPILGEIERHPRRLSEALPARHRPRQLQYGHGLSFDPKLSIHLDFIQPPDPPLRYPVCIAGGVGLPPDPRADAPAADPAPEASQPPIPQSRPCHPPGQEFDAHAVTLAMRRLTD